MAKKIKLNDAAKDLNVSSQEIISYFLEKGDNKKKSGSSLTEDEMNLLLEHYTKANEVSSFDGYFASKDKPKPVQKAEPEAAEKKPAKKLKKNTEEKKPEAKTAPVKTEEKKPEVKAAPVKTEEKKPEVKAAPVKTEEKKPEVKAVPVKTEEKKTEVKQNSKKKNDKKDKPQAKAQDRGERTKLNVSFSSETAQTSTQRRTVDTRGSYIDLDKYNERYDQMASGNNKKHGGGNYSSKKQKINQKSSQRNRQQFSRKETETEKLKRLELERARKQ